MSREIVSPAQAPGASWRCCVCGVPRDRRNDADIWAYACYHHAPEAAVRLHPVCRGCLRAYGLYGPGWLLACPEAPEVRVALAAMGAR